MLYPREIEREFKDKLRRIEYTEAFENVDELITKVILRLDHLT